MGWRKKISGKVRIFINDAESPESGDSETVLLELGIAKMLSHRVRYFANVAVTGSKEFIYSKTVIVPYSIFFTPLQSGFH